MDPSGIEPESLPCKGSMLPLNHGPYDVGDDNDLVAINFALILNK